MANKNRIKKLFDRSAIEPADTEPRSRKSVQDEQGGEASPPVEDLHEPEEAMDTAGPVEDAAGPASLLSEGAEAEITESSSSDPESKAVSPEPKPQEEEIESTRELEGSVASDGEISNDELLDDVRRSLIEEEADKKGSRWWQRIGKRGKKAEPEQASGPVEIDLPAVQGFQGRDEVVERPEAKEESQEDLDEIEDLIEMLEANEQARAARSAAAPPVEAVVEPEIDFDELKRQAFQPRAGEDESENISDVRSIALEGGEEVLVEVEARPVDPMQERFNAVENAFKPYKRYIYTAMTLLGFAIAVTAILIMYNVYRQSRPEPVQEASNLPYPTAVSLPGGWSFPLGKGSVQDGKWDPSGAEWLEGTEVCRWVALPWSTQLEAVIRTLNPKDPIELTMSNNDKLVYEVYSIRQLTPEQMRELDSNSPCLLLILTQTDSESRWVLTALP